MALNDREKERYAQCVQKKDLKDGAYYEGTCRNARVARWNAKLNRFFYTRSKFGSKFTEGINCPEDDNGFDLFFPYKEVVPDETIPPCGFEEKEGNGSDTNQS